MNSRMAHFVCMSLMATSLCLGASSRNFDSGKPYSIPDSAENNFESFKKTYEDGFLPVLSTFGTNQFWAGKCVFAKAPSKLLQGALYIQVDAKNEDVYFKSIGDIFSQTERFPDFTKFSKEQALSFIKARSLHLRNYYLGKALHYTFPAVEKSSTNEVVSMTRQFDNGRTYYDYYRQGKSGSTSVFSAYYLCERGCYDFFGNYYKPKEEITRCNFTIDKLD